MQHVPARWRAVLAIALAIVTALGISVTISRPDGTTVTVKLAAGPGPQTAVTTTPQALAEARANDHEGARDEMPAGVSTAALAAGQVQQHGFARADQLPEQLPAAAPQQAGCRSRFVANYSSRHGIAPRLFVAHYTVSANRPGFEDVNAITALFNRPSFAASSTYVIDRDGNCNYIVREADKPWTQAAFNPVSISAEIINTGRERPLFTTPGLRRFARIASDSAARWDIPVRRGKTEGCRVVRSGFVDHNDLGSCGGGHFDVTPFDVDDLIAAVKRHRRNKTVTARRCRELTRLRAEAVARRQAHRRPAWESAQRHRAEALKAALGRRENKCR